MTLAKIETLALKLALEAGKLQMKKFRKNLTIQWKGLTDPVTEVDQASERLIVKGIRQAFPSHAIVGEEGGLQGPATAGAPYTWFIDPLDGTVNYSHGAPVFAVSIGVWQSGLQPMKGRLQDPAYGSPVVGVVHAPALGETFHARRGHGAFVGRERITVSKQVKPLEAVLASGFAYTARDTGENVREWMELLQRFQAIRRMGAAAVDLCYVAAGRYDGFWEYGLKPWDVAAGGLIVEEAGGVVSNIHGAPYQMGKPGIVASNGQLQKAMLQGLKKALEKRLVWPPK